MGGKEAFLDQPATECTKAIVQGNPLDTDTMIGAQAATTSSRRSCPTSRSAPPRAPSGPAPRGPDRVQGHLDGPIRPWRCPHPGDADGLTGPLGRCKKGGASCAGRVLAEQVDSNGPVRIERVSDGAPVHAARTLFDGPPLLEATERFLQAPGHHLLLAYRDGERASGTAAQAVGMVSGIEMTHPDKGTEMFLYELSVAPTHRGRGIGTALVRALAVLATERGCYGMWVGTEGDNRAALATYRRAGATQEEPFVALTWHLGSVATDLVR